MDGASRTPKDREEREREGFGGLKRDSRHLREHVENVVWCVHAR